jgi:hypothetical protein
MRKKKEKKEVKKGIEKIEGGSVREGVSSGRPRDIGRILNPF